MNNIDPKENFIYPGSDKEPTSEQSGSQPNEPQSERSLEDEALQRARQEVMETENSPEKNVSTESNLPSADKLNQAHVTALNSVIGGKPDIVNKSQDPSVDPAKALEELLKEPDLAPHMVVNNDPGQVMQAASEAFFKNPEEEK